MDVGEKRKKHNGFERIGDYESTRCLLSVAWLRIYYTEDVQMRNSETLQKHCTIVKCLLNVQMNNKQ